MGGGGRERCFRVRSPVAKVVAAVLWAVLLVVVGTACISPAPPMSAVARSSPSRVPITILGGQGTQSGARPTVEVRVGHSSPVPVLLDTGSSGLHLFGSAVPTRPGSGGTLTSHRADITY